MNVHMVVNETILPVTSVRSLEALQALVDSLRHRMVVLLMDKALTAKELAERLKITRTRLYYHLDLLEERGIIRVVDERFVNGIQERRYRAVARAFRVDRTLLGSENTTADIVNAQAEILDAVVADLHANADGQDEHLLCARAFLRLTPERRKDLRARMSALLHEFKDAEPEGDDVEIALALFTTGGAQ